MNNNHLWNIVTFEEIYFINCLKSGGQSGKLNNRSFIRLIIDPNLKTNPLLLRRTFPELYCNLRFLTLMIKILMEHIGNLFRESYITLLLIIEDTLLQYFLLLLQFALMHRIKFIDEWRGFWTKERGKILNYYVMTKMAEKQKLIYKCSSHPIETQVKIAIIFVDWYR